MERRIVWLVIFFSFLIERLNILNERKSWEGDLFYPRCAPVKKFAEIL